MALGTYVIPEQFAGKTLEQVVREGGGGRADVLATYLGVDPRAQLTSGQQFSIGDIPGVNPSGSSELQFVQRAFTPVAAYQEQQQKDLFAKQEAEETDFLNRFRTAVEGLEPLSEIRNRVISEYYPEYSGIKEGAYEATEALRNVPQSIKERAGQVGMAANRIQARIQQKVQDLQPFVQDTLSKLEFIEGQVGQAFQLEAADRENALIPLQQEAAMLSERLSRELTGYTANLQAQTSALVQQLANQGALEVQQLKNLADMATAEQQYFDSEIVTVGGRKKLVNKRTGAVIADLGSSTTGTGTAIDYTNTLDEWLKKQQTNSTEQPSAWVSGTYG